MAIYRAATLLLASTLILAGCDRHDGPTRGVAPGEGVTPTTRGTGYEGSPPAGLQQDPGQPRMDRPPDVAP